MIKKRRDEKQSLQSKIKRRESITITVAIIIVILRARIEIVIALLLLLPVVRSSVAVATAIVLTLISVLTIAAERIVISRPVVHGRVNVRRFLKRHVIEERLLLIVQGLVVSRERAVHGQRVELTGRVRWMFDFLVGGQFVELLVARFEVEIVVKGIATLVERLAIATCWTALLMVVLLLLLLLLLRPTVVVEVALLLTILLTRLDGRIRAVVGEERLPNGQGVLVLVLMRCLRRVTVRWPRMLSPVRVRLLGFVEREIVEEFTSIAGVMRRWLLLSSPFRWREHRPRRAQFTTFILSSVLRRLVIGEIEMVQILHQSMVHA